MSLDLYVGETGEDYRVAELPLLLANVAIYGVEAPAEFPLLHEMVGSVDGSFEPEAVLLELERLQKVLTMERPYIRPVGGLGWSDLQGLRHNPRLLEPSGQFVIGWAQLISNHGEPVYAETDPPCSMLADEEKLYMVEATLEQLGGQGWDRFFYVSGKVFRWEDGLWVDGVRLETIPRSFRHDCYRWGEVRHARVSVREAWNRELNELERACRHAIEWAVPLEASI